MTNENDEIRSTLKKSYLYYMDTKLILKLQDENDSDCRVLNLRHKG